MNSILSVLEGVMKTIRITLFWVKWTCPVAVVVSVWFWWTWAFSAMFILIFIGLFIACDILRKLLFRWDRAIDVYQEALAVRKEERGQKVEVDAVEKHKLPRPKMPNFKRRPKSEAVEAVITED